MQAAMDLNGRLVCLHSLAEGSAAPLLVRCSVALECGMARGGFSYLVAEKRLDGPGLRHNRPVVFEHLLNQGSAFLQQLLGVLIAKGVYVELHFQQPVVCLDFLLQLAELPIVFL